MRISNVASIVVGVGIALSGCASNEATDAERLGVGTQALGGSTPDGSPCTSGGQCQSTYCYPGPDRSYCIAASANCAQPGTSGVQYGTSYQYGGVTYDCVEGAGLVSPPFPNGAPCTSEGQCLSDYCYPGPDQDYCIAESANCAKPGTDGVQYGTSYEYAGSSYDCIEGSGLVSPPFPNGAPCTSGGECASTYCYSGPDQDYCIAATANCAQPGTNGVQYGSGYQYQGNAYDCVLGSGLVSPPFPDGAPCTSGSECASTYCYPGPDQDYCIAATANCAQPGSSGVQYGTGYTYEGVAYDCVAGSGLVSTPFADGAPCTSGSQCNSTFCYPGPDQDYCIAESANCAQPATGGVQYNTNYVYQGTAYDCIAESGLVAEPFADGAPCTAAGQCSSGYCYPGPDQDYCLGADENCAQPGTDGIMYGQSYVYEGVTYTCQQGNGLVP